MKVSFPGLGFSLAFLWDGSGDRHLSTFPARSSGVRRQEQEWQLPKELRAHERPEGQQQAQGPCSVPQVASTGDLGTKGLPRETFNLLPRDPLSLSEKAFYKYLLSDYDTPSGLQLGLELG